MMFWLTRFRFSSPHSVPARPLPRFVVVTVRPKPGRLDPDMTVVRAKQD